MRYPSQPPPSHHPQPFSQPQPHLYSSQQTLSLYPPNISRSHTLHLHLPLPLHLPLKRIPHLLLQLPLLLGAHRLSRAARRHQPRAGAKSVCVSLLDFGQAASGGGLLRLFPGFGGLGGEPVLGGLVGVFDGGHGCCWEG